MNIKPAGKRLTAMASPQQTVSRVFSRRGMRSRQPVHLPNLGLIAAAELAVLVLSHCFRLIARLLTLPQIFGLVWIRLHP